MYESDFVLFKTDICKSELIKAPPKSGWKIDARFFIDGSSGWFDELRLAICLCNSSARLLGYAKTSSISESYGLHEMIRIGEEP